MTVQKEFETYGCSILDIEKEIKNSTSLRELILHFLYEARELIHLERYSTARQTINKAKYVLQQIK